MNVAWPLSVTPAATPTVYSDLDYHLCQDQQPWFYCIQADAVTSATTVEEWDAFADVFSPHNAAQRCRGLGRRVR